MIDVISHHANENLNEVVRFQPFKMARIKLQIVASIDKDAEKLLFSSVGGRMQNDLHNSS